MEGNLIMNTIPPSLCLNRSRKQKNSRLLGVPKDCASILLIAAMFILGVVISIFTRTSIKTVMTYYSYDVLVILIVMELFTNLIAETGIMQFLALKIARISNGKKRSCLMLFGILMFFISSCLNNITAVMMILPIVFVLLKTLEVDQKYTSIFFAAILALSNTGGAASPVGDFPAIVIMTSGITSFLSYLTHAFPLFAMTSIILISLWGMLIKKETDSGSVRMLAIDNLQSQYKNISIRFDVLKGLAVIFFGMFVAWSIIPQEIIPPEIIAVLGYVIAAAVCSLKKVNIKQAIDLKSVLTIASFLFVAQVISQTGILNLLAELLQNNIVNPKLLVMTVMIITSLVAGIFSAGPAAAAMMPVIIEICNGPLANKSDWIAVAYAAAICAGSSLFMWSATAGFILSNKIKDAGIEDDHNHKLTWNIGQYFRFGLANYAIQLTIALTVMAIVL